MKVVLFCGGLGMRMRDGIHSGPKPMAMIGDRPMLWHVMRYYAHFGHTDFVLCLGYGSSYVKDFFLNYDETRSNDFVLEKGATEDEPMFMANYADVLTDAPLPDIIQRFTASNAVASLLAVPPQSSHHVVDVGDDGLITQVTPMRDLRQWENGGYFVLRQEIFDHLNEGEDLVEDAIMRRLVPQGRVIAYPYKGYWSPADTVKERAQLDEMYHQGDCPWMIWDPERSGSTAPVGSALSEIISDGGRAAAPAARPQ